MDDGLQLLRIELIEFLPGPQGAFSKMVRASGRSVVYFWDVLLMEPLANQGIEPLIGNLAIWISSHEFLLDLMCLLGQLVSQRGGRFSIF